MHASTLAIIPILVSIGSAGFAFGIVLPVTSVVLEGMGVSTPLIGLNATCMFLGLSLGAPLVGRSIERYGIKPVLGTGLLVTGLCMVVLPLWVILPVWFMVRFIMGAAFAATFTACETLINRVSSADNRGRNLGIYAFAFSLSLLVGPLGLQLLSYGLWVPFVAGGLASLVAAAFALRNVPYLHEEPPEYMAGAKLVRRIYVSLATIFLAGFMEGALIALIPLYGLRSDFNAFKTSMLLFSFLVGHGSMPPLIGIIGDRIGLKRVLTLSVACGILAFVSMTVFDAHMMLVLILFVAGASVGGLYPLSIGLLAEVLASSELPRGNAMTTFSYGAGSILGPFVPAVIMHIMGPGSLFVLAAMLYTVFLIAVAAGQEGLREHVR